ncbi:MAG: hypothetical protein AB8G05_20090 [Oligoflexales bacterium]
MDYKYLLLVFPFVTVLSSCVTTKDEPITVSYKLPVLKMVSSGDDFVKANDIRIHVEPLSYEPKRYIKKSYQENDYAKYGLNMLTSGKKEYKVIATPAYTPKPDTLGFRLKITNQMPHILRLDGAVVAFRSDHSAIATDSEKFSAFKKAIILPGEEKSIDLHGPELEKIRDGDNITLALYDVISQTNSAGSPTKKSSFKWTYQIKFSEYQKRDNISIYGEMLNDWEYISLKNRDVRIY